MIRISGLPEPDFYITGVGTMIFDVSSGGMIEGFANTLNEGWDMEKVRGLVAGWEGITEQPEEQQHGWKSSWFWNGRTKEDIATLESEINSAGGGSAGGLFFRQGLRHPSEKSEQGQRGHLALPPSWDRAR